MVKEIMKDLLFLGRKAEAATKEDRAIAEDLLDTLRAHRDYCVGMAANMIGEQKAIIAIVEGNRLTAMLNPEVVKKSPKTYKTVEGCLSIPREREVERHDWIEVKYRDMDWHKEKRKFTGFEAEIIQHELDHLEGKLI
mgnify:FL=1